MVKSILNTMDPASYSAGLRTSSKATVTFLIVKSTLRINETGAMVVRVEYYRE